MSFFDFFKRKPKEPEPPRTRQDMEKSLTVNDLYTRSIPTARGTLQHSFQKKRAPQEDEKKLLKEAFDLLASVPQGQKLLDEAVKAGYDVHFESFCGSALGSMSPSSKKIMLSSGHLRNPAVLAITAVHEMTHVIQQERTGLLGNQSAGLTLADQFKFHRAAEAAACTEEAKFAYQIRDQHPEIESRMEGIPMYQAFVKEMEKSGDMAKAGEACFKAWYSYKHYQTAYEANHVRSFSSFMNDSFVWKKRGIDSEAVLNGVFFSEDIRQNISPDFLTSKEAFSISEKAREQLEAQAAASIGKKDTSLRNMYSYETGQTYASQEQPKEAAAASIAPQRPMTTSTETKTGMRTALVQIDKAAKTKQAIAAKAKSQTAQH
ncbi:MAG: hypothetical protein IJ752_03855 [Alphaproteobacteria bacterium]|nr:hypothetical protein [Alphaproteobacteria bacterium]